MAILTTNYIDGDILGADTSTGGKDGLNDVTVRVNTHTHDGSDTVYIDNPYVTIARAKTLVTGNSTATGAATLGTVPVNKVWYITDIFLSSTASSGDETNTNGVGLASSVIILNGTNAVTFTCESRAQTHNSTASTKGGSASATSEHMPLNLPYKLTAGQTVGRNSATTTSGGANASVSVSFIGWEEDA